MQEETLLDMFAIRRVVPDNVNLPNQHRQPNHHCDRNDWQIHSRKFQAPDSDMLPSQDITPQHTSKRRTERQTKCTIVDTNSHTIDGTPESAIRDRDAVLFVDLLPCLNDTGDEDRGSDVCAGKLLDTLEPGADLA
jgi:hypothetical protein